MIRRYRDGGASEDEAKPVSLRGVVPENGGLYSEDPRERPVVEPDRAAPDPAQAPPRNSGNSIPVRKHKPRLVITDRAGLACAIELQVT